MGNDLHSWAAQAQGPQRFTVNDCSFWILSRLAIHCQKMFTLSGYWDLYAFSCSLSTDFEPYKFIDSEFQNCTFSHNKTGCQISFDDDYSAYWIYFVNFLGTLAVLPGNIVSALLMDRIGRLTMLGRFWVSGGHTGALLASQRAQLSSTFSSP